MKRTLYSNEFPSTIKAVGEVLSEAIEVVKQCDWCCDHMSFSVRLCIEEALVNAVRHGNKENAEPSVRLDISEDGECCRIRVTDHGNGFDPSSIVMPDCDEPGGRGVCLIKHFTDDVQYNHDDNCLEMVFRLNAEARK